MKKYIPFPIDLSTYPEVRELTCLQFGILMRIIEGFWKTGREIPKNEYTLYHAIRCPYKAWSMSRDTVLKVLMIVLPDIAEARKRLVSNKLRLSQNAVIARGFIKTKPKLNDKTFSDDSSSHTNFTKIANPQKSWHEGHFDHVEKAKALKNKDSDSDTLFKGR